MGRGGKVVFRWITKFVALVATGKTKCDDSSDSERYIIAKDVGADTTLFVFSGMAALYGGMPAFEFRKQLQKASCDFNLVFIRDIQRWGYHVSPEGDPDGLAFFERVIRDQMESLGASRHIALGASTGGAAALYFGTRCNMAKVVAFGPIIDEEIYCCARSLRMAFSDFGLLLTGPIYYVATISMILFGRWALRHAATTIGSLTRWDILADLRNAGSYRPIITVLYADRLHSDVKQATLLGEFPEARLVPVPTANHNCAGYLKGRGRLTDLLRDELGVSSDSVLLADGNTPETRASVSQTKPNRENEIHSSNGSS